MRNTDAKGDLLKKSQRVLAAEYIEIISEM